MRTLSMRGALGVLLVVLAACGGSSTSSDTQQRLQREADYWEIDQIEKNFHKATTLKDIDLLMSLWAPNATLSIGPELTASGKDEIRRMWLEEGTAFQPGTHLISDHPAYKVKVTVSGDRGTLHFECHYVDFDTGEVALVTEADLDVARIDGRWLITNMVGGTAELTP
jgi:ketosteroid isomerase-like protein